MSDKPQKYLGLSKHRLYRAWAGMVNRCTNPNNSHYHLYGGRGVSVCNRWRAFKNFLDDMGERPDGMSLDRIDPAGNYEPSNCRWATASEQRNNYTKDGDRRQREGARIGAQKRWVESYVTTHTEALLPDTMIIPKNGEVNKLFLFFEDGRAEVNLDGYLICPMEMFTREQWRRALRKYRHKKDHAPDWQKDAANVR